MKLKGKFLLGILSLSISAIFMGGMNVNVKASQTDSQVSVTSIKNEYKNFKAQKKSDKKLSALKTMNAEYKAYNKSDINIVNQYKKDIKAEKNYFIKKDKTTLKHLTLSKKDLNRSWKMMLDYKIKMLKSFRKTLKNEKGIVYTNKQYKSLISKSNIQSKRYVSKLKHIKNINSTNWISYDYTDKYGDELHGFKETKGVIKNNILTIIWQLDEHNGKITYTKYDGKPMVKFNI
ncbi:putative protein [Lactobacillus oligofermentans DSM 15707 = LMG 22743] [Lactiplantibacillus mudanjiangensis]|uniref:hypothetical protein n=1 Tax=Lactiplantibacillus mudanjiangensis TaxID=1296538 RepID=UPI0010144CFA|nr:putative protein [Lactobacillus oligofermentans DSM 15707 = LMG 22743] [Lactiplantibacillus mudanjiangensis]